MVAVATLPVAPKPYDYWPHGGAAEVFRHRDRELLLDGPAGTGKTLACLWKVHLACLKYPGVQALMVRKTLTALTGSAMVALQNDVLGSRPDNFGVRPFGGSKIKPAGFKYPNGSEIAIGGMDKADKIKSTEYDIIYVNEATELTVEDWETLLSRRHRNPNMAYTQLMADCNPDSPTHWLYQRIQRGEIKAIKCHHQDNPTLYDHRAGEWTPVGADYIAGLQSLTGVRRQRLYEGLWAAAEGLVFDNWDATVHLLDDDQVAHMVRGTIINRTGTRRVVAGVDWGFTHPGSITIWAIDGDGRMYAIYQVYQTGKTIDWWLEKASRLQLQYGVERWICDPAEPGFITQFRGAGLHAEPGNNDINAGINEVHQRLAVAGDGRPRLYVRRDSLQHVDESLRRAGKPTGLADEFTVYVWDTKRLESGQPKPVDANNHAIDPARYVAMYLAGSKSKQIRSGY